jgi:Cu-Zn family superoxide dismutase
MDSSSKDHVHGYIYLEQAPDSNTLIKGYVEGLSDGEHGFHIHADGNLNGVCLNAGAHYNPFTKTHGSPGATVSHVGDLGNIVSSKYDDLAIVSKNATINIDASAVQLSGQYSVIGRSFVVHADTDDMGKGGYQSISTKAKLTRLPQVTPEPDLHAVRSAT